jgi:hypothetical protein
MLNHRLGELYQISIPLHFLCYAGLTATVIFLSAYNKTF